MASNSVLQPVRDRGWLHGFGNLVRRENHRWWGTRQWIVQILIWTLIVNGILAMLLISAKDAAAQARNEAVREAISEQQAQQGDAEAAQALQADFPLPVEGVMVFFIFLGMATGVGVAILGQEAIVQEKQTGTAAWVLSKPASRIAFVLSKIAGNALGILVTMVAVQGLVAWVLFRTIGGVSLPVGGFIAGLGLAYLNLLFYLLLAIMLGTLFDSRGPVIGITLLLLFGFQIFTSLAPWLFKVMPWILVMSVGEDTLAYATMLAIGQPLPSTLPIIATALWCLVFAGVSLWRFSREEF